jgi:hypothetical protein
VKKLAFTALLAAAATQADASVVISFTGDASLASYTRTYVDPDSTYAYDLGTPTVSGTIVIDTDLIKGTNGATPPAVYYDAGGAPFLTGTFFSTGATPLLTLTGTSAQYIAADPDPISGFGTIEFTFGSEDPAGIFHSTVFTLGSYSPVPTILIGGVLLPDFSQATDVYFSVTSQNGSNDNYVEIVSQGYVSSISAAAVPEPLTWATMATGFGLVGGAVRRRRRDPVAA